jgi:hypothetical protein
MKTTLDGQPPTFVPWDIEVAQINFGANCGPASFAAITGMEVCRVMRYFRHFEHCRWTNLTQMHRAFGEAGYTANVQRCGLPSRGVALVQWLGPWTEKNFFSRWSLVHTHWISVEGMWIFDHNACCWQTLGEWAAGTASELMLEVPRATGWRIKYGMDVTKVVQTALGLPWEDRGACRSQR